MRIKVTKNSEMKCRLQIIAGLLKGERETGERVNFKAA
jgi:hypothetical protein